MAAAKQPQPRLPYTGQPLFTGYCYFASAFGNVLTLEETSHQYHQAEYDQQRRPVTAKQRQTAQE